MNNEFKPNWALLAGWRFVLAVIVVLCHMSFVFPNTTVGVVSKLNAYSAVIAFLMISGYSIAHSIRREQKGYLARRFWRIYPIYILCFVFAAITHQAFAGSNDLYWLGQQPASGWQIFGHLFFTQSVFVPHLANFTPSWSLGVEVAFYAFAPLLLRFSNNVAAVLALASCMLYLTLPRDPAAALLIAPTLLWSFLVGWLAYSLEAKSIWRLIIIASPFVVVLRPQLRVEEPWLSAVLPGATLIFLNYSHRFSWKPSVEKGLNYLGDISFPLYLGHLPALSLLAWCDVLNPVTAFLGCWALSHIILVADAHIQRRRRFYSFPSPSLAPSQKGTQVR